MYYVDASGDVVLEMWGLRKPFAPWTPDTQTWPSPEDSKETGWLSSRFYEVDPARKLDDCITEAVDPFDVHDDEEATESTESPATARIDPDEVDHELPNPSPEAAVSAEVPALAESSKSNGRDTPTVTLEEEPGPVACFLLSSKHLTLASPYFKTMLGGGWLQTRPKSSAELTTRLRGFDIDATLIVMRVIHGQLHETPTAVSLELLAKIAVVVDYLGCHEVFRFVSRAWFADMTTSPPDHYCRELVLWILVAKVFSQSALFEAATKTAIAASCGRLQAMNLPLPDALIGRLALQLTSLRN